jgi:hypothetical protein
MGKGFGGGLREGFGEILLTELFVFGLKQARACLFPGIFITILLLSSHVPLFGLARYDFIFVGAVLAQVGAGRAGRGDQGRGAHPLRLPRARRRARGLQDPSGHRLVELPEEGFFEVFGVPLYSGFMYASVASYMCQAWRLLDLDLKNYPPYALSVPLSIGIYLNFFTHHLSPTFGGCWPPGSSWCSSVPGCCSRRRAGAGACRSWSRSCS